MTHTSTILRQWRTSALVLIVLVGAVLALEGSGPWLWDEHTDPLLALVVSVAGAAPVLAVLAGLAVLVPTRTLVRAVLNVSGAAWTGWWPLLVADLYDVRHAASTPKALYVLAAVEAGGVLVLAWGLEDRASRWRTRQPQDPTPTGPPHANHGTNSS